MAELASMSASAVTGTPVAIRVFTPINAKASSFFVFISVALLLGLGGVMWMVLFIVQGVRLRDWNCLLALTLLPILWIVLAVPLDVLVQVLRTGGTTTYLRINLQGVLAYSCSPTGPVRCIDDPSLDEREDRVIVKTSNMGIIVLYHAHTTSADLDRLRACVARYQAQTATHGHVRAR